MSPQSPGAPSMLQTHYKGDCASSTDDAVIYGINLGYDNELKMQSRPEPGI